MSRTAPLNFDGDALWACQLANNRLDICACAAQVLALRHDIDIKHAAKLVVIHFRRRLDLLDVSDGFKRRGIRIAIGRPQEEFV